MIDTTEGKVGTAETVKEKVDELAEGHAKTEEVKGEQTTAEKIAEVKAANDLLEAEMRRGEELRAKNTIGGKAEAGKEEKTPQQESEDRAKTMLEPFGY